MKKFLLVLVSLVVAIAAPMSTYALTETQMEMFAQNNILFYDPEGGCTSWGSGGTGTIDGSRVTVIGDSISDLAKSEYEKQLPGVDLADKVYDGETYKMIQWGKYFVAEGGYTGNQNYHNYDGMTIARKLLEHNEMREYLVFALGTNNMGDVTDEWIANLVNLVGTERKIVLTTEFGLVENPDHPNEEENRELFAKNSAVIRTAGERYSNVAVADWAEAIEGDPLAYIDDGWVHPNDAGQKLFVELIKKALSSLAGSTYGAGTTAGSTLFVKVLNFLLSLGLNDKAAAGIYGNMMREGLGTAGLLEHEDGVDSRSDIGTLYEAATHYGDNGLLVQEEDVRDLDNPEIMHGLGFIQWSFGRRVDLLNYLAEAGGLDVYAREWNDISGQYVYDGKSYNTLVDMIGQSETDRILDAELGFFDQEHSSSKFNITQSDIDAQGLSQYGVRAGMPLYEALNLLPTVEQTTELFFTTSEMPGRTTFGSDKDKRVGYAWEGLNLIYSSGLDGCTDGISGGGSRLASIAVKLAWPNEDGTCDDGGSVIDWTASEENKRKCYNDVKPAYRDAVISTFGSSNDYLGYYQDCAHFVSAVVGSSGLDSEFPQTWTRNIRDHLVSSDKWVEIENLHNTTNLLPGDVFIARKDDPSINSGLGVGHVMIYTGDYSPYGNLAEASQADYTGKMRQVYYHSSHTENDFRIFRYVGGE